MENGRLQNEMSAEFIVAHAEFIFAKGVVKQVADDHRVLVFTTQKNQMKQNKSCKHEASITKQGTRPY